MDSRYKLETPQIESALKEFENFYSAKLNQKGPNIFVSLHEIRGLLAEEVDEFNAEVVANNKNRARYELLDIMTICLHSLASIDSGRMDW